MLNETSNDITRLETGVRDTIERGEDIQDKVRKLTLDIIGTRSFDIKSVRQAADAVLRGARAGIQKELQQSSAQTGLAREHLGQAVTGLDVALAQFAEAAKLTLEEAAGKAQKYSNEDLKLARADLGYLESMFMESLQSSALAARDAAGEILHDLAAHARTHGSAIGAQLKETLSVFAQHIGAAGHAQVGAGLHLAKNTADIVRKIAAGALAGLAEHVSPDKVSPGKDKGS